MKNPLEALLVNESEVPRLKAEYESARETPCQKRRRRMAEIEAAMQARSKRRDEIIRRRNVVRRISVKGAVIDILGEGDAARVIVGSYKGVPMGQEHPNKIFSMCQKEVEEFITEWLGAVENHNQSSPLPKFK